MNSKWESESRSRNLSRQASGHQILRKVDPYYLTVQSFNVLLLETRRNQKAEGEQGNQLPFVLANARPRKDEEGAARCPPCSQNAHDEKDWKDTHVGPVLPERAP